MGKIGKPQYAIDKRYTQRTQRQLRAIGQPRQYKIGYQHKRIQDICYHYLAPQKCLAHILICKQCLTSICVAVASLNKYKAFIGDVKPVLRSVPPSKSQSLFWQLR